MYKYADGSTGSSPYQKDASGGFMYGPGGSVIEGQFLGTANGGGGYTPGLNASAALPLISNGNGNIPITSYGSTRPTQAGGGSSFGGAGAGAGGEFVTNNKTPYQQQAAMPNASAAGSISGYTAGQNPYLQQQGDQMTQQMTQNLQRNVLPRIGSQAMASGGYGGSRQGVIESNAMSDMNSALASGLANLYSSGYGQNLQYDLGRRSQDQSYDLGRRGNDLGYYSATNQNNQAMGNLGLGYAGLDRQINNDNLSWQQQGYNNNMGLWNQQMANNQTGIGAGTTIQNTPMNYLTQFGNLYNSIGQGYGNTTTSGGGGNPMMGALGGAQLGSQVANWWNGGNSSYNPGQMGQAVGDNQSWFNSQTGL
jgi:hypothetical protein